MKVLITRIDQLTTMMIIIISAVMLDNW